MSAADLRELSRRVYAVDLSAVSELYAEVVFKVRDLGVAFSDRRAIKVMKLLWDAIGSEFGGRHELYERNYFGNHESIRFETLMVSDLTGASKRYKGFAEQCMAEYNLDGWLAPDMIRSDDVSALVKKVTT